jgi:hypothetical protein
MPSVEYAPTMLVWDTETREATDPETGETVTQEIEHPKRPFEVRISKWLERPDGYHVYGFVEVTDFGQALASKSEPFVWVTDTYETAAGVTQIVVSEWLRGVGAVQASKLGEILSFGGVNAVDATVTADETWRMDYKVVLSGATTFDIEWLAVDFDPSRGGQ